ncbi:MAG: trypsin-like peptidase domain-containing protein [Bacteroidia bacterium]|nr:trypsin-like peptidase domain-containing protein [Bacteroidia bacterium]MBT8309733.1 trypsin-like peptidase domain-containing protein [Bacteroidia bacterium]NND12313.1 PDZ domain-containing protein [Flavobacteriaceae bacterium]NNK28134.1 PDZ domain-containing protein [Flavobacteriaceae bacterium]NNL60950.1 PDZ domain-containing protein [Flavobacteriaceae bacterium]
MRKIATLVIASALGGVMALGTYMQFVEKEEPIVLEQQSEMPLFVPTKINTSNAMLEAVEETDFVAAAENTVNAVVHVKSTTINDQLTFEDLFFGRRTQRSQVGSGSGVIISPDGYIVTNNHVIEGSQSLTVTTNDNKTMEAVVIGTDPKTDIALLKIDADEDLVFVPFGDSDTAQIGEWVLAVGNPFNLTSTVTAGIISAKSRDLTGGQGFQSFIQTDAAVNPGNSGGALVNTNGELIGINTAITSATGSYVGYSFAVPSNIASKVVSDILEYGNVQNGILGVSGASLNSEYAEKVGIEETEGFYVDDVTEKSGAAAAGIRSGDIIKKLDNVKINKFADLRGFLSSKRPNDVIKVTILRRGNEKVLPVKLTNSTVSQVDFMGLELRNLSSKAKKTYGIEGGAYVFKTTNKEWYDKLGLRNGYIITEINDEPINSIIDILQFKKDHAEEGIEKSINKIEVLNNRGQKERYIFK